MKHAVVYLWLFCLFRFQINKIPSLNICYRDAIPKVSKMLGYRFQIFISSSRSHQVKENVVITDDPKVVTEVYRQQLQLF